MLLHGLATSMAFWYLRVAPALAGFRVTVFDLRGHGRSEMPSRGYSTPYLAFDLYALMDELDIGRAHLVGHSFGGEVALHFAALYPWRVRSLVLADVRVRSLHPTNRLRDWPNGKVVAGELDRLGIALHDDESEAGQRLLEEFARLVSAEDATTLHPATIPDLGGWASWGRRAADQWLRLLDTTTARQDFRTGKGPTYRQLRLVDVPVLATYGELSPCLPSGRALERVLPSCRTELVPQAGHFHPVTHLSEFLPMVKEFLEGVESATAPPTSGKRRLEAPARVARAEATPASLQRATAGSDETTV